MKPHLYSYIFRSFSQIRKRHQSNRYFPSYTRGNPSNNAMEINLSSQNPKNSCFECNLPCYCLVDFIENAWIEVRWDHLSKHQNFSQMLNWTVYLPALLTKGFSNPTTISHSPRLYLPPCAMFDSQNVISPAKIVPLWIRILLSTSPTFACYFWQPKCDITSQNCSFMVKKIRILLRTVYSLGNVISLPDSHHPISKSWKLCVLSY